jgi:uncharacterized oxidoreductase
MLKYLKASPAQDPAKPVLVPGEPERTAASERSEKGIEVAGATWEQIVSCAEGLGVSRTALEAL